MSLLPTPTSDIQEPLGQARKRLSFWTRSYDRFRELLAVRLTTEIGARIRHLEHVRFGVVT